MSIVKVLTKLFIAFVVLAVIYTCYYLFIVKSPAEGLTILKDQFSGLGSKILPKNNEAVINEKNIQPVEVSKSVESSESDLNFLIDYAKRQNISIPEDVMQQIRSGNTFVASSKLKQSMTEKVVGWKDLTVIQIVYQTGDDASTNTEKQKSYNALNKLISNVNSGGKLDAQVNILKTSIDSTLISVQSVSHYDCSNEFLDAMPEIKEKIKSLDANQNTGIIDRDGYSYIVGFVTASNKSPYCSLDDFIKDNKK